MASLLKKISLNDENQRKWAILDLGASSHFLLTEAPARNKRIATSPLRIKLPNGKHVASSHTCELDIPNLPAAGKLAHVVPGLQNFSLVSVVKWCNAGCRVITTDVACEVFFKGHRVIQCKKCTRTGVWTMPLADDNDQHRQVQIMVHVAITISP